MMGSSSFESPQWKEKWGELSDFYVVRAIEEAGFIIPGKNINDKIKWVKANVKIEFKSEVV
jgi:hypothetical protein